MNNSHFKEKIMSIYKKIIMAIALASSMAAISIYPTTTIAAEDQAGSRAATQETIKAIEEGIAMTKNPDSTAQEVKAFYFNARQEIKDITGETIARDLQYANDSLFAVSRALKVDDKHSPLSDEQRADVLEKWEAALKQLKAIQQKQI
jgi:hypothetical protein